MSPLLVLSPLGKVLFVAALIAALPVLLVGSLMQKDEPDDPAAPFL